MVSVAIICWIIAGGMTLGIIGCSYLYNNYFNIKKNEVEE